MIHLKVKEIRDKKDLDDRLLAVDQTSEVNQKIARYIEKKYNLIVFMTADNLSNKIGVSQGSVSRFCTKMGYNGYNDFLRYLQKIISSEMTIKKRHLIINNEDENDKNLNILNQEINNLKELQEITQTAEYKNVVEILAKSDKIFLMSNRMSETLLPYMYYIFSRLRPNVYKLDYGTPAWENVDLEDPKKSLIFTTFFPRYSSSLLKKMQDLNNKGFKIISITDSRLSPIVKYSKVALISPITISSVFDVYSTPLLLINLLMRDISSKIPNIDQRLNRIEEMNKNEHSFLL
ncbi:MurR/RpiR family transcriptional regulator [Liquorilactobacillus sicerae]|uniref:MurR/RpiR family transcriptional regulator n=1 Tax=Liquorilactobacillus sicerae TaxID=1416943 RepID=UPI00248177D7|nr:MurR/RpiR family transcriptional regulator [Liquorilactobacillus sicerae]